ncbi:hypothetical protein PhCBS80983_g01866 [Powellomyces hirtus]|uniref:Senescence domain-containing protein n=1 Tax=Powellomyces hirtus TaxID=109895 RepID=A0A507E8A1_9FUNG|nr:hypothetical protein PhCBS80983_g01866 [Powellomyces hirtus]
MTQPETTAPASAPAAAPGLVGRATGAAQSVAKTVEPYVPQLAKNAASYALSTAQSTSNFALATAGAGRDRAVNAAQATTSFIAGTAVSTKDRAVGAATAGVNLASNTAKGTVNYATSTVYALTPSPVYTLLTSTLEKARDVKDHPLEYTPAFIVNVGGKSYEIVNNAKDRGLSGINATTGFVVTRTNGVIERVHSVPAIHSLIEQLQKLTAPVLEKLGVSKPAPAAEAKVVSPAVAPAAH